MKKITLTCVKALMMLTLSSLSFIFLQSCAVTEKCTVTQTAPEDEIIVVQELREFLKKHPTPRVVLRVPTTTATVTNSETKQIVNYNNLYGQIEKNLMRAGFVVRDRGLLNNLLSSEQNNYTEVGKKIETDIIIEIINFDFKYVTGNKLSMEKNKYSKDIQDAILNRNGIEEAVFDCKIVIVEKGQTGGILTLYKTACEKGCNFNAFVPPGLEKDHSSYREDRMLNIQVSRNDSPIYFLKWDMEMTQKETVDYFSQELIKMLKNQL